MHDRMIAYNDLILIRNNTVPVIYTYFQTN